MLRKIKKQEKTTRLRKTRFLMRFLSQNAKYRQRTESTKCKGTDIAMGIGSMSHKRRLLCTKRELTLPLQSPFPRNVRYSEKGAEMWAMKMRVRRKEWEKTKSRAPSENRH